MNRSTKVPFRDNLTTDGSGLYCDYEVTSFTTHLQVPYIDEDEDFGELRVYFNSDAWDIERLGVIYTDRKWLKELCDALSERGYDVSDIGYSEYGMQGRNYVSLDVGKHFLASWFKINCPVEA